MREIKINSYGELEKIKELNSNEFIVDLQDLEENKRERIIDFLSGLVFMNGSIKKINNHQYEIKIVK